MRIGIQPVFIAAVTVAACTIDFPDRDVSGRYACANADDCMRDYACVQGKCVAEHVPTVSSFTASPVSVGPGGAVTLTAVFDAGSGGTATIDQGVGTIASGVAKSSGSLAASTTFTLTVSAAIGTKVTAQVRVLAGALSVLAGVPSGNGSVDGTGAAARFYEPGGVAVDAAGNVYVADQWNHTIRKITSGGVVSTLAGSAGRSGSADGTGTAARFSGPVGVTVDAAGNVYVTDAHNNTIRKITSEGVVSTLAGRAGEWGSADGTGAAARFFSPTGIAVDTAGSLYVVDRWNHTIRKITSEGVVSTLAGRVGQEGSVDGSGTAARFNAPFGVAVDTSGTVYVADTYNSTIRQITAGGVVSTLAGSAGQRGSADGTGASARFYYPYGVAMDTAGNIYVADTWNHTIRQITAGGVVSTLAGSAGQRGSADGTGAAAAFYLPSGVAVDAVGTVYVGDTNNHTIRKIALDGVVSTLAGSLAESGSADGAGAAARFDRPFGVAMDTSGTVYVADTNNHTIRKITSEGVVSTLAGSAGQSDSTDGTGPAARFRHPIGVAVDTSRSVYVADTWNGTIRKITAGGVVSTLAGSAGQEGSDDGVGAAARFDQPSGVAVDAAGNVYVADTWNHTIRKITSEGAVSTLAGSAGQSGSADGAGAAARFDQPSGVAVDAAGNVYVTDTGNHTIRKIMPGGVVSTLAGTSGQDGSVDGTGAAARFGQPFGVAVDAAGNVYVADTGNHTIRKITTDGVVTTIIGSPSWGINLPKDLPAFIAYPRGVAVSPSSTNLYVVLEDAVLTAPY